ncbi:DNA polymerase-3 subunit alpha (Gram-positive type) [Lachnospiraceae bacterium PM6-15]|uniref:PolC-type DNA polymerase III n=1 Tax=Ohessyouella blattaphilus TaxID=2949333 RepID=UPI003E238FA8
MDKGFSSVFPSLKLDEDIQVTMQDCEVLKVATNRKKDKLRLYLVFHHLVQKSLLDEVATAIKTQLFGHTRIKIEIVERFELSELYTPEYIFGEYGSSIMEELSGISVIAAKIFESAKISFDEGNIVRLELLDSFVTRDKQTLVEEYLLGLFRERMGIPIDLRIISSGKKRSALKDSSVLLEREVMSIVKNSEKAQALQKAKKEKEQEKKEKPKKEYTRPPVATDPGLFYGRAFDEEPTPLNEVTQEMGEIVIKGKVISQETREIKGDRAILIFVVTDFTDSIKVKFFVKNERLPEMLDKIKKGKFLKIKGVTIFDQYDKELEIGSIAGISAISDFTVSREDLALRKRVELHCHTKMSDMDAVSEAKDLVKRAHDWGHAAIAITDHGVVQAFPDAYHYIQDLRKADPEDPFKVIYGVEAYLVDDLQDVAVKEKGQSFDDSFVVFDLETTGFSRIKDKIIEIGAVKVEGGEIVDTFSTFVNPERPIPYDIIKLTSIDDNMVKDAPKIEEVFPQFLEFVGDSVMVAHNAPFDMGFIEQNMRYQEIEGEFTSIDTVALARILLPDLSRFKLNNVAKALKIKLDNHHRAVDDAGATAEIFVKFIEMLKDRGVQTLAKLNELGATSKDLVRKSFSHHAIILATNQTGMLNLYRLISKSHLDYFNRSPKIPKTEFSNYREGLILGTACEAGELFQAIINERPQKEIAKLVNYYDFLEIQPTGNNAFMLRSDKYPQFNTVEDLQAVNEKIIELGERFEKPVVATCDVHFLDPDDEIYRRIIMAGKGFDDADLQPPLYLHTTEEMLEEFSYLGSKKAEEVVIENPNKIAAMIEDVKPISPDKCPPEIEGSDEELRRICYDKAHSIYGENLPKVVSERLETELDSIISNGYAVMYIIAQKLVWKSVADGYLVGSRGSVGSSFVATMAGITEVNPLGPHYYCSQCHYYDFDSDLIKEYADGCGFDMPDRECPECGAPLHKEGFNIPFETFLGFAGESKEPDIDLNFSGEYQSKAHKYTEELFGEGYTFKAGTVGTLADKTAFGFVKKYYDEKNIVKRNCEVDRIVSGCTGVRRSTGQHPGGIIVLPKGHEINEFTPVQRPANDVKSDIITTHFDYHSIDANLLKLDILGHDDPTMIKSLENFINSPAMENEYGPDNPFKATDIPLDEPKVMSLFHGTEALGIKPEDIDGTKLGCLGIPEFGTDFVIQMVIEAKPQNLSDLLRISGLSHGTDVWINNAQELIKTGKATISTAICTRDDIMVYLINKGLNPGDAFKIMEQVRKGRSVTPAQEEMMLSHDVPEWYIWSCKLIKYMFPKAHAAAYVMMAYRIAYCKIYHPLAYYASYFGIRADAFSYEQMCMGQDKLKALLKELKAKGKDITKKKEEDTIKDMRLVQEMYARGFDFVPIDIYKAKAYEFQIIGDKLMPPLSSIDGLGEKAAIEMEQAAKEGPFLSKDDFKSRSKVSQTVVDTMGRLGLLGDIPESNQLSLFDI